MLRSLRVADLVIKFLEAKRIKSVFLVPGGGAMFLNDALSQSKKIDFVANHHEQASVIAAEAYSRMTENIGVAMVTTGPGATNAVTGVAGTYIDSIPLLIISGQVKRSDMKLGTGLRQKGPQEVNIVEMISPITKYAKTIMKPSDVLKELNLAFNHATTGRKGPVWIDIPLDIQNSKVSYPNNLLIPSKKRESEPTKTQIRRVLSEIKKAERPLLLLGGGVRHASGKKQIKQLVDRLPFIVATTWSASDLISFSCYKNIGKPGSVALRPANFAVQNCDLLLVIGARLDNVVTGFNLKDFARHAQKIVVDIDSAELEKFTESDVYKIKSDAKTFTEKLSVELVGIDLNKNNDWIKRCAVWKQKYGINDGKAFAKKGKISHAHLVSVLSDKIPDKTTIITGSSGLAVEAFSMGFRTKCNQRLWHTTGLGAMGYALPSIIGAYSANKKNKIIALEGDGSLQMNLQELSVISGLNIPVTLFIVANNGYASIRNTQRTYFQGNSLATERKSNLFIPDIRRIFKAFKIDVTVIKKIEDLEEKVDKVINNNKLNACIVEVDPNESLYPKLKNIPQENGAILSMPLEDLSPMLKRHELEAEMVVPLHVNSRKYKD